jgi:phosphoglycerate dehydrogenase-like enzyme
VKLQVLGRIGDERLARIRARCPDATFDDARGPEVVFVWEQRRNELAPLLSEHGNVLRWVHFRRVGIGPDILRLFDAYPDIVLTSGSGASGIAVAEHVLAVILALAKRLPETLEHQRQRNWVRGFDVAELHGQTACIVGLGDLGQNIARLLRALGLNCIGIRRQPLPVADLEVYTDLGEAGVLERSQWLILAAPLSPATRHMIGANELARLPRGSYVVNVARGQLIDELALVEALHEGHLGGAALDVLTTEPLPAESELWTMPNVIVTPHSAAHTQATDDRSVDIFLEKLARFRRGEQLDNQIVIR